MSGESILIVDDNPLNLKLIKVLLSVEGYEVKTAMNADQTISLLAEFHPRIILMDVQLPGMDGLTLATKIKSDPQYKDIIILAVTAFAMKGDEEKALAAGCDGYITKPIKTEELPSIVANYLYH